MPFDHVDVTSWTDLDVEEVCRGSGDSGCTVKAAEISVLSIEDIRLAQAKDTFCAQFRAEIDTEKDNRFVSDDHGV